AQVFIDQHDVSKTQLLGACFQLVLALLAFTMMAHLIGGRLPHIDVSGPFQMFWLNPVVHRCSFPQRRRAVLGLVEEVEPTVHDSELGSVRGADPRASSWAGVVGLDDMVGFSLDT